MKLLKLSIAVLSLSLSTIAPAESGGDRTFENLMSDNQKAMAIYAAKIGKDEPQVQSYHYRMKMDIVKVINVTPPISSCGIVPSRMTYEDSNGKLNTIEYQVMGECGNDGS